MEQRAPIMKTTCCKITIQIVALLISLLDFICDYIFFENASTLQPGLVYGRVEPNLVTALLVFSIIGTVLFSTEICACAMEIREILADTDKGAKYIYHDLLLTVITYAEDIPQLIISVLMLLCREEAVSLFQLAKAALSILGCIIDTYLTITRYLRQRHNVQRSFCMVRAILAPGMLIIAGLSIAVFVLSFYEEKDKGIEFRDPTTVTDEYLSDQKYFADVNVFIRDAGLPNSLMDDKKSNNWMSLFSIYELKDDNQISLKLNHTQVSSEDINMEIWVKNANTKNWTFSGCYNIKPDTTNITQQSNSRCSNNLAFGNSAGVVYMDFRFEKPGTNRLYQKFIFGQIYFNYKIAINGTCMSWDSVMSPAKVQTPNLSFLSYFRITNSTVVNNNKYFYSGDGNATRYFSSDLGDIISVDKIWKTGWKKCASSGSMLPVLDAQMNIECN